MEVIANLINEILSQRKRLESYANKFQLVRGKILEADLESLISQIQEEAREFENGKTEFQTIINNLQQQIDDLNGQPNNSPEKYEKLEKTITKVEKELQDLKDNNNQKIYHLHRFWAAIYLFILVLCGAVVLLLAPDLFS